MGLNLLAIAGLFLAALLWGSTFILVKWAIAELDVYYFLFLRFGIASLLMILIGGKKLWQVDRATLKASLILGMLLATVYIVQTEGLRFTSASNAALITGMYVVLIPSFLALFFRKKAGLFAAAGSILAVIGLYLLTQYSFTGLNRGDALTVFCAFACAWHIIAMGYFTVKHPMMPLAFYQFLLVTVVTGAVALGKGSYTLQLSSLAWHIILITSIFCTVVVFLIQLAGQRVVDPTRTGIIFVLEAVFGALFAWWWGGEQLTTVAFFGAVLMVVGAFTSELGALLQHRSTKAVLSPQA